MNDQLWWFVVRSSGLVAWGAAAAAVIWGLTLTAKPLGRKPSPAWTLDLHRFLGTLTLVALAVHLSALVADSFTYWGAAELAVPYATTWKAGPVAWGIVAAYLLVAVEVSSLLLRWLPRKWWRRLHMTSYLVFAAATIHLVSAGTDASNPLVLVTVWIVTSFVAFLTLFRVLVARSGERRGARGTRTSSARDEQLSRAA
jgi:DMSO/TMAO reductase YedYZ heme-binding membrane subunit